MLFGNIKSSTPEKNIFFRNQDPQLRDKVWKVIKAPLTLSNHKPAPCCSQKQLQLNVCMFV